MCGDDIGSGGLAIFVGFSPLPYFRADAAIAPVLWTVAVLYIAGPLAYASSVPERLRPRTFDYVGASHQVLHLCVLAAALLNDWCMQRTRELRYAVGANCTQ